MRGPGSRSAARGGVPGLVPVTIGRSWFPLSRTFCDMFVPAGQPVVVVWGVERFDADQETQAWATAARIQRDHDRRDRPVAHLLVDRVVNGVNVQGLVRAIAGAGGLDERLDIDAVALHRELLAAKLVLGLRASRSRRRMGDSEAPVSLWVKRAPQTPIPREPLAQAWLDTIGGPLPRDADARESVTETVLERHPELVPLVERSRQRALLAGGVTGREISFRGPD